MTDVLQFGTSRFLQAHADLFFQEGTPQRTVTVVQTSGDPDRARRLQALAAPGGYPVRIRGLMDGRVIDEETRVRSIRRTLSTASDWRDVVEAFCAARLVISNTGDAGYRAQPADEAGAFDQAMSFPAKLAHLMKARSDAGADPVTLLPLELLPDNGPALRARVRSLAEGFADESVLSYIDDCTFMTSLVDRIVSSPIEPAGAVAEPYALWAIKAQDGFEAPTVHPAIRVENDLERTVRLKLHILNLGHTVLAHHWLADGSPTDTTVRDMLGGPHGEALRRLYEDEVVPGFARRSLGEDAADYVATTLERFANPFLDHRLADIAQNHEEKVARRIRGFLDWAGSELDAPTLNAIALNTPAN